MSHPSIMLASLAAMGRRRPLTLSLITSTAKTLAADVMTQRFIEGCEEVDMRRAGLFSVFGLYYLGGFQYFLYVRCFSRWFPAARAFGEHSTLGARLADTQGLRELAAQTALGNFVHIVCLPQPANGAPPISIPACSLRPVACPAGAVHSQPLLFLPAFYITQEVTQRGVDASPTAALQRYRQNCVSDWLSAWAIWVPGHAIFFSVPLWVRLPTNHAMSFAYVCVLSLMRGRGDSGEERQRAEKEKVVGG